MFVSVLEVLTDCRKLYQYSILILLIYRMLEAG